MRIIQEKENKGFTLVEIIVSMLVLSITIVSVLSAFTVSAKSNKLTRKLQSAEALMEDLTEYIEAGGENGTGRDYTAFSLNTPTEEVDPLDSNKKTYTIQNVSKGFNTYTVKVMENSAPDKYSADKINDYEVFTFGGAGSNAILINASLSEMSTMETEMLANFMMLHQDAVDEYNADQQAAVGEGSPTPAPESYISEDVLKTAISRELQVRLETVGTNQVAVKVVAVYEFEGVAGVDIKFPTDEESKFYERQIYQSAKYALPTETIGALNQIYIMFSASEMATKYTECEIRILNFVVNNKCDIYVIRQGTDSTRTDSASLYKTDDLRAQVGGASAKTKISFVSTNVAEPVSAIGQIDLYCSEGITVDPSGTLPATVTAHANSLIASQDKVRAVEITVEIIDPDTGSVLLTNTGVYLK